MGCLRMSLPDFEACTPSEFYSAYEAWSKLERRRSIEAWDQARIIAVAALQPYSKKKLKLTDICTLEFDKDRTEDGRPVIKGHGDLKRMKELERLVNNLGNAEHGNIQDSSNG